MRSEYAAALYSAIAIAH